MKHKLLRTPPQHKILEGESQKLKQKLDSLKKQIQAKKKEKEISKSAQSYEKKLSQSRKSNTLNSQTTEELNQFLVNLKLESIASKLKDKKIVTLQQLHSIKTQELDSWKDIAIGYRIKLKKYLQIKNNNLQSSRKTSLRQSPQKVIQPKLGIEQIIKNRKEGQKYVPIKRNNQQAQMNYQNQLDEQEQQFMIQSLKTAFNFNNNVKKSQLQDAQDDVSQDQFDEIKYEKPVERVKTAISQKSWQKYQKLPDYKYCWTCLTMLKENIIQYHSRQFCSQACQLKYKQTAEIKDQNLFFENIEGTEKKFQKLMYDRYMSELQGVPRKQAKKKMAEIEVEELDLTIE